MRKLIKLNKTFRREAKPQW